MNAPGSWAMLRAMDYTRPQYSDDQIDAAGVTLVDPLASQDRRVSAVQVFGNWRAAHNYPLNSITTVLRLRVGRLSGEKKPLLVFQRLKRIESVEKKLRARPDITLSTMQDIGGCRAIVRSVNNLLALRDQYIDGTRSTHQLTDQE